MPLFPESLNHESHGTGVISHGRRSEALIVEPGVLEVLHVLKFNLVAVPNRRKLGLNSISHRLNASYCAAFGRRRGLFVPFDILCNVPNIHQ